MIVKAILAIILGVIVFLLAELLLAAVFDVEGDKASVLPELLGLAAGIVYFFGYDRKRVR